MENYTTKRLPHSVDSQMEWNYPEELPKLNEDQILFIKENMDCHVEERSQLAIILKTVFIDPFSIAFKKFSILKKINTALEKKLKDNEYPTDVVMLMLYEDSIKYSAITFSEIIKKIIIFINGELKGKYLQLLRKNGLKKVVRVISENNPAKSKDYNQRLTDYENIWDVFFPSGPNDKCGPKEQDLENLKQDFEVVTKKLRTYRDKVAAHFDEDVKNGTVPILLWTEIENIILHLQQFLVNFNFLLTHTSIQLDELDGVGFTTEENTVKSFISGIFRDC